MAKDVAITKKYAALDLADKGEISHVMEQNLGVDTITEFDLDRVNIPTGGGKNFSVPTLGENETQKTLTGIIVFWKKARAYWEIPYEESGGGSPPDCRSDDGEFGIGNPGGLCAKCPLNEWGSANKGDGKACKELRFLFMLTGEELLPLVVTLPPTSLTNIKKYFLRLASRNIPYYAVETKLSLQTTQNRNGIKYSEVAPQVVRRLTKEDAEKVWSYAESMKSVFETTTVSSEDYDAAETL